MINLKAIFLFLALALIGALGVQYLDKRLQRIEDAALDIGAIARSESLRERKVQNAMTKRSYGSLLKVLAAQQTIPDPKPTVPVTVASNRFEVIEFPLIRDALRFPERYPHPENWRPQTSDKELGERLPFNWTDEYIRVFGQPFNPDVFFLNAIALSRYRPRDAAEESLILKLKDELLARLLEYTVEQDGALFVVAKFRFSGFGGLEPPWASAFSQGQVLSGLYFLHSRFREERILELADKIFRAFTQVRDADEKELWISAVDDRGLIWFEEYPTAGDPQPQVLNGHIWAVAGLYYYYHLKPVEEVLALYRGGVTSAYFYVNRFRQPGDINLYGLTSGRRDYDPARTVFQQFDLFRMSGEPYFLKMSEVFKLDIGMD